MKVNKSLNPFGTGQCLSTMFRGADYQHECLNPFGTGQCLSTAEDEFLFFIQYVIHRLPNFPIEVES